MPLGSPINLTQMMKELNIVNRNYPNRRIKKIKNYTHTEVRAGNKLASHKEKRGTLGQTKYLKR